MENVQPWWMSRGVWGSLITIVATAAGFAGYAVTPEDQLVMIDGALKVGLLVTDAMAFVGGLTALWGRIRATKRIG